MDEKKEVTIGGQPILILGDLTQAAVAHEHLFTHGVKQTPGINSITKFVTAQRAQKFTFAAVQNSNTRQATTEDDYEMPLVDIPDHFRHSRSSRSGWGLTALHPASRISEKLAAQQRGV